MVLFGIEALKQIQYVFSGASQNNLCRCGGCWSKGSCVILEDLKHCVAASQRGSSTFFQVPGIAVEVALLFH